MHLKSLSGKKKKSKQKPTKFEEQIGNILSILFESTDYYLKS